MKNLNIPYLSFVVLLGANMPEVEADQLWSRSPSSVSKSGAPCYGFDRETLRSQDKIDSLTQRCLREVLSEAPANAFRRSDDGRFSVVAWKDMIFVEKHNITGSSDYEIIRAKSPELNNIKAIATDSPREELYVLDENSSGETQLLVYQLKTSGDQSPLRIVRGEFLKGADSLSLDPVGARLYLGHSSESKITVLRQMATLHHAGKEAYNPEPLQVHRLAGSIVPNPVTLSVDPKTGHLYVFDGQSRRAALLEQKEDGLKIQNFDLNVSEIRTLNVNAAKRKLELWTSDGFRNVSLVE